jgi:molybdate transport system permease protein
MGSPLFLSLRVALLATLLAGVLGTSVAALLTRRHMPLRHLVDALFTAPLVLPPTVLGYYLLVVVGRPSAIGRMFERLTGQSIVFTRTGAVIAATVSAFPFVVKSARTAIESVDPTLTEVARTLGATPIRAFFTVVLPLSARGLSAGLMLAFARALGDFGVTLMVAGDIPDETQTASLALYDAVLAQDHQQAGLLAALLAAIAVLVGWTVNRLGAGRG